MSGEHRPRKRFGQNFLVDPQVIDKIVAAIAPGNADTVVEIGPGRGAITEPLLSRCGTLHAVELDRDLAALLTEKFARDPHFQLHRGDALVFDLATLDHLAPLRVVGNLPYNISTPLLFHLMDAMPLIRDMHFMLQKEVVERLAAVPSTKAYGRLSVITQYFCEVDYLFTVPAGAFNPVPGVESAIVRLAPRKIQLPADDEPFLRNLVKTVFQQRRKTLRNTLKQLPFPLDHPLSVDLSRRPETLSVDEFVVLANELGVGRNHGG